MKIFKIILILIFLIGISIISFGNPDTLELDTTMEEKGVFWHDFEYESEQVIYQKKPDTLLLWFKSLTLDEKVELYLLWKNKNVDWKENCIEFILPKGTWDYDLNKEGD